MKLFCFLGNIGDKYLKTRHNAGFLCGDFLQKKWGENLVSDWKTEKKFFGKICEIRAKNFSPLQEKILLLKPSTFMNLSGKSLLSVMNFYKILPEDICIFYDDKDLKFEKIRFRKKGSAGGHNGIKDIIRVLGIQEFDRIKIGVDNEKREYFRNTADFVLANFTSEEQKFLEEKIFGEVEQMIKNEII